MILIDEGAEDQLVRALEAMRIEPDNSRYVYFKMAGKTPIEGFKEIVIESARRRLAVNNPSVYFCGDGDVFILAPSLPSKDAHPFILDVSSQTGWQLNEEWVAYNEVHLTIGLLIEGVDKKIAIKRDAEAQARRAMAEQQVSAKRQSILRQPNSVSAEHIKKVRSNRVTPQFMIIEDDIFSCRLVEKVLKNRFPITKLHEATHALDTYAITAPNLLFLDINLPDVTGHELLARIMAMDPDAYVVMLSANADRENIVQAMKLGAKGFIAKPFNYEKLMQYIERCPSIKLEEKEK